METLKSVFNPSSHKMHVTSSRPYPGGTDPLFHLNFSFRTILFGLEQREQLIAVDPLFESSSTVEIEDASFGSQIV